jgi:polysaccharide export outer membrane protein
MNNIRLFIFLISLIIISSCANKKNILYLQDFEEGVSKISQNYENRLQADDILNIMVSSPDQQGVQSFNLYMQNNPQSAAPNQSIMLNYTIRKDGTIEFPVIGKIKISELTILETIALLKQKLSVYINNPVIVVEWINFKFTILGEVNKPGQYRSQNERVTLLDALGMAGDLDIYGQRKNIMLIRDNGLERKSFLIDITNKKFIDSEAYYIKQNDVIIVSPNNPQIQASAFNRNMPLYIAVASTIISVIVLLTR